MSIRTRFLSDEKLQALSVQLIQELIRRRLLTVVSHMVDSSGNVLASTTGAVIGARSATMRGGPPLGIFRKDRWDRTLPPVTGIELSYERSNWRLPPDEEAQVRGLCGNLRDGDKNGQT